ncbi:unnamed protein product [Phytophthora fragariaefolia]|uniref:Unnamed protein product n=1 Tax=Phytophthora fragariaefolia TaxID=1490495 RepID=A0A9W6XY68_9STRA|nr:unnamed protein product [Phytophthora fragariaefolia]
MLNVDSTVVQLPSLRNFSHPRTEDDSIAAGAATKMALTIPVAWKDAHHEGLNGVVEVHSSDFIGDRLENVFVSDFIKIINEKICDAVPMVNAAREVKHLLLHGVRVHSNYSLECIVPELMGSCPRLVATMTIRPCGFSMVVFVRALSGKILSIQCKPTDTVRFIKARIEDKQGVPLADQCLTYACKQLQDHLPLSSYNISNASTLHLTTRVLGGISEALTPFRTFADVSDGSILTAIEFSPTAPEWRLCSKGLNIEGRCRTPNCRAFRHMVIDPKGFHFFNLMKDDNIRCPICSKKVKPVTCGLYDCCWRFEGVKADDGLSICSQWKEAKGYVYHRFDADESDGVIEWASLLMVIKQRNEAISAKLLPSTEASAVSLGEQCSVCWCPFRSPAMRSILTTSCGHTFHRVCSEKWSAWCKRNSTQPSCPICRRTT